MTICAPRAKRISPTIWRTRSSFASRSAARSGWTSRAAISATLPAGSSAEASINPSSKSARRDNSVASVGAWQRISASSPSNCGRASIRRNRLSALGNFSISPSSRLNAVSGSAAALSARMMAGRTASSASCAAGDRNALMVPLRQLSMRRMISDVSARPWLVRCSASACASRGSVSRASPSSPS